MKWNVFGHCKHNLGLPPVLVCLGTLNVTWGMKWDILTQFVQNVNEN